jgi:multicomponent Na+:H+ antiporter subunit F
VNLWLTAALALLPPLAACAWLGATGRTTDRLVALQLATALAVFMLILFARGFDQPSYIDLALTLVLLSLPGTLVYAHVLERWL